MLKKHTLKTIVKLPENLFFGVGVKTSVFVFKTGRPQGTSNIIGYYIADDGLETVKNQGRQDIRNKWTEYENYWIKAIHDGVEDKYNTRQIINPQEHLSYQIPLKPFQISQEDFIKTVTDYEMFKRDVDTEDFSIRILAEIMYTSQVKADNDTVNISIKK